MSYKGLLTTNLLFVNNKHVAVSLFFRDKPHSSNMCMWTEQEQRNNSKKGIIYNLEKSKQGMGMNMEKNLKR
jgi:hypothetical protein